tara:strand:+ start:57 stop:548 length:492 start_codon:yes stop_codon:yes gene_type:complete
MGSKKKVVLTKAQENAIFKVKPQNSSTGNTKGPSWAELGRKYKVSPRLVQKAWANANGRSGQRKEKALTTFRESAKTRNNPTGKSAPINRLIGEVYGDSKARFKNAKKFAQVKDVTAKANQEATKAIRILNPSERVRGGGGGPMLSLDDILNKNKPGRKPPTR